MPTLRSQYQHVRNDLSKSVKNTVVEGGNNIETMVASVQSCISINNHNFTNGKENLISPTKSLVNISATSSSEDDKSFVHTSSARSSISPSNGRKGARSRKSSKNSSASRKSSQGSSRRSSGSLSEDILNTATVHCTITTNEPPLYTTSSLPAPSNNQGLAYAGSFASYKHLAESAIMQSLQVPPKISLDVVPTVYAEENLYIDQQHVLQPQHYIPLLMKTRLDSLQQEKPRRDSFNNHVHEKTRLDQKHQEKTGTARVENFSKNGLDTGGSKHSTHLVRSDSTTSVASSRSGSHPHPQTNASSSFPINTTTELPYFTPAASFANSSTASATISSSRCQEFHLGTNNNNITGSFKSRPHAVNPGNISPAAVGNLQTYPYFAHIADAGIAAGQQHTVQDLYNSAANSAMGLPADVITSSMVGGTSAGKPLSIVVNTGGKISGNGGGEGSDSSAQMTSSSGVSSVGSARLDQEAEKSFQYREDLAHLAAGYRHEFVGNGLMSSSGSSMSMSSLASFSSLLTSRSRMKDYSHSVQNLDHEQRAMETASSMSSLLSEHSDEGGTFRFGDDGLRKFLDRHDCFETTEGLAKRAGIVKSLDTLVKQWVRSCGLERGLDYTILESNQGKVLTYGSCKLEAADQDADMDLICIAPHFVERDDFFNKLFLSLKKHSAVRDLRRLPEVFVPVMKFRFNNIEIDFTFCQLQLPVPDREEELLEEKYTRNLNDRCLRSLNGYRATCQILTLVPNIRVFQLALCAIKLWGRNNGVYGNILGYLGGASWAILVAKTCQEQAATSLVHTARNVVFAFFQLYSQWRWPMPVYIRHVVDQPLGAWDPSINSQDRDHCMPIITSSVPQMNSAVNISKSVQRYIQERMIQAHHTCIQIQNGKADWDALFKPFEFYKEYERFIKISGSCEQDSSFWFGCLESKLRHFKEKIEMNPRIHSIRIWPKGYTRLSSRDASTWSSQTWFIGFTGSGNHTESLIYEDFHVLKERCFSDLKKNFGQSHLLHRSFTVNIDIIQRADIFKFLTLKELNMEGKTRTYSSSAQELRSETSTGPTSTAEPEGGRRSAPVLSTTSAASSAGGGTTADGGRSYAVTVTFASGQASKQSGISTASTVGCSSLGTAATTSNISCQGKTSAADVSTGSKTGLTAAHTTYTQAGVGSTGVSSIGQKIISLNGSGYPAHNLLTSLFQQGSSVGNGAASLGSLTAPGGAGPRPATHHHPPHPTPHHNPYTAAAATAAAQQPIFALPSIFPYYSLGHIYPPPQENLSPPILPQKGRQNSPRCVSSPPVHGTGGAGGVVPSSSGRRNLSPAPPYPPIHSPTTQTHFIYPEGITAVPHHPNFLNSPKITFHPHAHPHHQVQQAPYSPKQPPPPPPSDPTTAAGSVQQLGPFPFPPPIHTTVVTTPPPGPAPVGGAGLPPPVKRGGDTPPPSMPPATNTNLRLMPGIHRRIGDGFATVVNGVSSINNNKSQGKGHCSCQSVSDVEPEPKKLQISKLKVRENLISTSEDERLRSISNSSDAVPPTSIYRSRMKPQDALPPSPGPNHTSPKSCLKATTNKPAKDCGAPSEGTDTSVPPPVKAQHDTASINSDHDGNNSFPTFSSLNSEEKAIKRRAPRSPRFSISELHDAPSPVPVQRPYNRANIMVNFYNQDDVFTK